MGGGVRGGSVRDFRVSRERSATGKFGAVFFFSFFCRVLYCAFSLLSTSKVGVSALQRDHVDEATGR